jgi:hypothetical protein|tara:strand:- start:342 stop:680 length:339 start_codon:yes stop_codon:yes gene_type:complete
MARLFTGNVSVALNTKNKIVVKPNSEGKYNQENVTDLVKACNKAATDLKDRGTADEPVTFKPFTPPRLTAEELKTLQPVLLEGYGKSPYIAMLPEQDAKASTTRRKVEILDV